MEQRIKKGKSMKKSYQEFNQNLTLKIFIGMILLLLQMPAIAPDIAPKIINNNEDAMGNMFKAYGKFIIDHPVWIETSKLDALRSTEYGRLDKQKQIYLDYTGSSLYSVSQIKEHWASLIKGVYGNPHSHNPTSALMTKLVNETRDAILRFFNASGDEYTVIFTPNASGALKLVGESYPFAPGDKYLLTYDNHNSVNGIREFAKGKGAEVTYVPIHLPSMCVDEKVLDSYLNEAKTGAHNLFAYPAQSNYSGIDHPLEWIARAQSKGWDVLLDAAAYVPTNELDLSKWHPEFVDISFYKMFGYPTGVGCLIAKHTALAKLKRPWFSGGTIEYVSVQIPGYYLAKGYEGFEDGTINFLNLPAVKIGLDYLDSIGVDMIHDRVNALTDWTLKKLNKLHHANGKALVMIYGPTDNTCARGGTIAMNFYGDDGKMIDWRTIEDTATKANISLRTGCFCNPGCAEIISGLTQTDIACMFQNEQGTPFSEYADNLDGKFHGAVRISFGIASNFADAYKFIQFAKVFKDKNVQMFDETTRCASCHHCEAGC